MIADLHTHILPGIDDGSRNSEMTEALLREEAAQGVALIAATPHFYPNRMTVEGFLEKRAEALARTEKIRRDAGERMPEIVCGAEVYYFRGIGQAEMIPKLCIGDTKALLLEMPFEQWESPVTGDIRDLTRRGMKVILAHVERYTALQKKRDVWDRVMAMDVVKQINAGSFLKEKGIRGLMFGSKTREFSLRFLKEHPETVIGTDCHNMEGRRPRLAEARETIAGELGKEVLERMDQVAEGILGERKISPRGLRPWSK